MSNIKKLSDRIKKNKDARTLITNFGYLSILQIAGYIFPLITIPYLSKTIGVEGFGKIAFASAVMVWFQTVSDWGFNYTATRDIARNKDSKEKVSEIFSNVFWARIILIIICFFILVALILIIPKFRDNTSILLVSYLLVPGYIMYPDWFFQAIEKMRYITIMNIISKIIFTIAIFVFIKEKKDFILQPLFFSLGYITSGVISMYIILFRWNIKLKKPKFPLIIETLKNSTDVFINNLMPNFYNSFSTVVLGFFGGSVANGTLDAGTKFISISRQFMIVVSRVFFPFLSRRIDKHNLYVKINLTIAFIFSLGLFIFSPIIIKFFYTSEFYDAIVVLRITSFSIIFLALSNIFGTNYMIIQGYEKELRNITFVSSLIGLCLSIPLVYYYSYIGAAITVTLTRGLLGITIMFKAMHLKKKSNEISNM